MQVNWRDRPLDWQADRTATGRILDNLLSNAIAYGEDGGLLELRAQQRGDLLLLEVANSGDEIGAEDRKQVFDPFYQGRARRKGPLKGSGIGLSVAADCAKAQQGHLELVDDARLAVCFRLTLPWQACSVQSEHQQDTNTIMMPSPQHRAADADARNS
jgi:two-component system sensor histidine kinase GlrK